MTTPPSSLPVDPEPPPLPGYFTVWAIRRVLLRSLLLTAACFALVWREISQDGSTGELAFFALFVTTGVALCLGPASLVELRARAIGVQPGAGQLTLAWALSVVGVAALVPEVIYAIVMLETGSMAAALQELQRVGRDLLASRDDVLTFVLVTTLIPLTFLGASAIRMELLANSGRNGYVFFTFPMGLIMIVAFAIVDIFDGFVFGRRWHHNTKLAPAGTNVPPAAEPTRPDPPPGTLPP